MHRAAKGSDFPCWLLPVSKGNPAHVVLTTMFFYLDPQVYILSFRLLLHCNKKVKGAHRWKIVFTFFFQSALDQETAPESR